MSRPEASSAGPCGRESPNNDEVSRPTLTSLATSMDLPRYARGQNNYRPPAVELLRSVNINLARPRARPSKKGEMRTGSHYRHRHGNHTC